MSQDPIHRSYHHNKLTFRMIYAFHENYVLPLSHDEVVHGKGSLIGKMPGDDWQKFANLRLLFGYMYAQPAKKLIFMGGEIGQWREWAHDHALDWHLLANPLNRGLQRWIEDLNQFYRRTPAMHRKDFSHEGFQWIDCNDVQQSTLSLMRFGDKPEDDLIIICNFTPVPRPNYRVGVSFEGYWEECLNSDASEYGGSNQGSLGRVEASPVPAHGRPFSINIVLPPLGIVIFRKMD
jgi:1,4-alpha-glucan branching enzyme